MRLFFKGGLMNNEPKLLKSKRFIPKTERQGLFLTKYISVASGLLCVLIA